MAQLRWVHAMGPGVRERQRAVPPLKNETAGLPEGEPAVRFDEAAKRPYIYMAGAAPPPLALGVTAKLTF